MPDEITERVENVGALMALWNKSPAGFTIVFILISFYMGNVWGRADGSDENKRLITQVENLQKNQELILNASLVKNGIIQTKNEKIEAKELENENLTLINDTLSKTINQVGEILIEAEKPAIKILNK